MKTYKVDFSKGINVVTDKRLVPEGYIVLADNIDLRSGSLRPFKFPEPYVGIYGGIPAGTTCIYEFKNNWFFSSLYRDYTSEYVSAQTRVYFCETTITPVGHEQSSHLPPQKVVNGVQANLGAIVPSTAPVVTGTTSYTPAKFSVVALATGGSLTTGSYSYRISAIVNGQIMPPSQALIANVPQVGGANVTTGSVNISWDTVPLASGYAIFGRILGQEQTLFTMGAGATAVSDNGSAAPSGAYAVNYQPLNPLTYVYTYVRDVGTMQDESGPSPISNTANSSYVRTITRNPLTDGLYSTATLYQGRISPGGYNLEYYGITANGSNTVLTAAINSLSGSLWWVPGLSLTFGLDTTNTLYTFTLPSALVAPATPNAVANAGSGFPTGTYQYAITAIRGQVTGLSGGHPPAETTASLLSNAIIAGSIASITVSWPGVNGASGYNVYRYTGGIYYLAATITGDSTTFTDIGAAAPVNPLPFVNETGIIYNPITPGLPVSWDNPSPLSLGNVVVVTETLPAGLAAGSEGGIAGGGINLAISNITPNVSTSTIPFGSLIGNHIYAFVGDNLAPVSLGVSLGLVASNILFTFPAPTTSVVSIYQFEGAGAYNLIATLPIGTSSYLVTSNGTPTSIVPATLTDQDVIYISSAPQNAQIGTATYYAALSAGVGVDFLNIYSPPTGGGVISFLDVPNNGYYKYWNIYRAGDAGTQFVFVAQVSIGLTSYVDTIGVTGLGEDIPTAYDDVTTGGYISFEPPPVDLLALETYNGMLFGIDGNLVRWTPTDYPDAWPSAYNQSFAYPPQRLVAYSGGIYIFCENGVWRGDGFLPGQISFQKTRADGCIAPYTPRIMGSHLLYVARRGIMALSGMDSSCVTERFIPYRLLTEPSAFIGTNAGTDGYGNTIDGGFSGSIFAGDINGGFSNSIFAGDIDGGNSYSASTTFWWLSTDHTSSYGALLDIGMNPIPAADTFGWITAKDKPISGLIWEARSFVWQNKYYLYFVNTPTNDYQGNPCWCVDFGILNLAFTLPNYPISTLGFKPTDMHTSSTGECYALLTIDPIQDPYNQTAFAASQAQFDSPFFPVGDSNTQAIYRFNPTFGANVPIRFRTSEVVAGAPQSRKRWREVRLNGQGTCQVRVFIDGVLLAMASGSSVTNLILSESPIHPSRILLPPGSWGYSCSIEVCGDATVRLIEMGYDPMTGED